MDSADQSSNGGRAYSCIHCGVETAELFHSYSPTVLKISECVHCKLPADEYIECDVSLVLLDLFLQKLPAYRHVLCNGSMKNGWRLLLIFVLCDAYYNWVESKSSVNGVGGSTSVDIYDLEWHFYVNILQASIEAFVTMFVLAPLCLWIWHTSGGSSTSPRAILVSTTADRCSIGNQLRAIINKLQIGFYGNVLVLLAVVWEQHQSISFVILTRIFLFASHVQVFRALSNASLTTSAAIVLVAMIAGKLSRFVFVWCIG